MSVQADQQAQPPISFEDKIAKSSQVNSVTYDPDKKIMSVIFKRTEGFRYDYLDFPAAKWAELQAADSIGSYLYRNVTRPMQGENAPPYQFVKVTLGVSVDGEKAAS